MKKLAFSLVIVLVVASVVYAASLLGTVRHPFNANKYRTTWAYTASSPSGIINSTTATTAYNVATGCDTAKIKFGDITGTNIMNVAVQVADLYGPGTVALSDGLFTNAAGTASDPYLQVDPSDTDKYKFDLNSREFTVWKLKCLVGCDVTNSIGTAWGDCWMAGTGGR